MAEFKLRFYFPHNLLASADETKPNITKASIHLEFNSGVLKGRGGATFPLADKYNKLILRLFLADILTPKQCSRVHQNNQFSFR